MLTNNIKQVFLTLLLLTVPGIAFARGSGAGSGVIFLLILFAPLLIYLLWAWILICCTLLPIGMGIYFLYAAREVSIGVLLLSSVCIAFGIYCTKKVLTDLE